MTKATDKQISHLVDLLINQYQSDPDDVYCAFGATLTNGWEQGSVTSLIAEMEAENAELED